MLTRTPPPAAGPATTPAVSCAGRDGAGRVPSGAAGASARQLPGSGGSLAAAAAGPCTCGGVAGDSADVWAGEGGAAAPGACGSVAAAIGGATGGASGTGAPTDAIRTTSAVPVASGGAALCKGEGSAATTTAGKRAPATSGAGATVPGTAEAAAACTCKGVPKGTAVVARTASCPAMV